MDPILFYGKESPLSNFYSVEIEFNGSKWITSEHIYQSYKFIHCPWFMELIKNTDTPAKASYLAKQRKNNYNWYVNNNLYPNLTIDNVIDVSKQNNVKLRDDWESVKYNIMREIVFQKFYQNIGIKIYLLNTMGRDLIENSPTDYYWGIGARKTGKNMLGIILMEVRQFLFNQLPNIQCKFIINDHRILIGNEPNEEERNSIFKYGINYIINFDNTEQLFIQIIDLYRCGNRIYIYGDYCESFINRLTGIIQNTSQSAIN